MRGARDGGGRAEVASVCGGCGRFDPRRHHCGERGLFVADSQSSCESYAPMAGESRVTAAREPASRGRNDPVDKGADATLPLAEEYERLLSALEPRQRRFVEEYQLDLCGKGAAIRAGYSARGAEVQGHRLLSNAKVQAAIREGARRRATKLEIRAEAVIRELALIGFSDIRRYMSWDDDGLRLTPSSELTRDETAVIADVIVKRRRVRGANGELGEQRVTSVRLHDKLHALDLLAKHLGLFDGPEVVTKGQLEALLQAVHDVLSDFVPAERREAAIQEIERRTKIVLGGAKG